MENAVQKHFDEHFARLTALTVMHAKTPTKVAPENANDPVENHKRIDTEAELHDWNVKLVDEDLRGKYVSYLNVLLPYLFVHSKIICQCCIVFNSNNDIL